MHAFDRQTDEQLSLRYTASSICIPCSAVKIRAVHAGISTVSSSSFSSILIFHMFDGFPVNESGRDFRDFHGCIWDSKIVAAAKHRGSCIRWLIASGICAYRWHQPATRDVRTPPAATLVNCSSCRLPVNTSPAVFARSIFLLIYFIC